MSGHQPPAGEADSGTLLLAGDVGGTKTTLALVSINGGAKIVAETTFASREHASLEDAVGEFLRPSGARPSRAAFSVAGPVIGGRADITNLPWVLDTGALRGSLGVEHVLLVNDLQATAFAIPHLRADQLSTIHPGTSDGAGAVAVVAVGTGLGEAMLVPRADGYEALPSEGGHTDFAPRSGTQRALLAYLQREMDHVSFESVCSGIGIPNLYRFLASRAGPAPEWLAKELAAAEDPTPVIVEAGLRRDGCGTCRRTLSLLAAILGAEAGNAALRMLSTGGVYVGGGIPPRILPALRSRAFHDGFTRKGKMTEMVSRIPVHVILEPRAALLGAARYGLAMG